MPVFKDLFSDVLTVLSGVEVLHRRELAEAVVARLDLTDDERAETLHGGGNRVASRVHWATEYLVQSEAVARPRRGILQITDFGRTLLAPIIHHAA